MDKQEFVSRFMEMQEQRKIQKQLEERKELIRKKREEYIQLNNYYVDKGYRLS